MIRKFRTEGLHDEGQDARRHREGRTQGHRGRAPRCLVHLPGWHPLSNPYVRKALGIEG